MRFRVLTKIAISRILIFVSLTEPTKSGATMRRTEVRTILRKHRGAIKDIAADLGVTVTSVVQWLNGRMTSERIESACQAKASELVKQESKNAA